MNLKFLQDGFRLNIRKNFWLFKRASRFSEEVCGNGFYKSGSPRARLYPSRSAEMSVNV